MQTLSTLVNDALVAVRERKQKRKFNFLLAIFLALVAMTAIALVPVVRQYAEQKTAVATWTDGLTPQAFGTETWTGTGTEADAFQIASATDLAQLACNVNAGTTYEGMYFTLTREVNLIGKEWTPIGTLAHPFMGTFDGGQNAIYSMTITGARYDYVGLFGVVESGDILYVDMRNSYIDVDSRAAGGVVGYALNTSIGYSTNGSVDLQTLGFLESEVTGVTYSSVSSVQEWYNQAQKRGTLYYSSKQNEDIAWETNGSTHTYSSANSGGICGKFEVKGGHQDRIHTCWNTGNITASNTSSNGNAGGIAGWMRADASSGHYTEAEIYICASVAKISGGERAGGIVGYADAYKGNGDAAGSWIAECYAVGIVSCSTSGNAGSIIGAEYREDAYVHLGALKRDSSDNYGDRAPTVARYCYWFETGWSKSYGSSDVNTNNTSSTTSSALVSTSSKSGWTSSNWNTYTETSSTSGTKVTYKKCYISPNGASSWSAKSSSPYNYYTCSETLSTYTVTLNDNSGSGGSGSTTVIEGNSVGTVTVPTRNGYTFEGYWTTATGGTQYINSSGSGTTTITKNITLYAHWTAKSITVKFYVNKTQYKSYTTTYDSTYGKGGWPSSITSSYITSGYTWDGYWYSTYTTNSSGVQCGSGDQVESGDKIADTYTTWFQTPVYLYAGLIANSYTITLSATNATNNASGWTSVSNWETSGKTATQEFNSGATVGTFPTPTRTGYTFNGWYNGGTKLTTSTTVSSSLTYTASWTANKYTVTLNKNASDATAGTTSVTATYGSAMPSGATPPSRSYYNFNGYYTSTTGGTQYYTSSMTSARTWDYASTKTLYAQWTAASITVSYNTNGGTSLSAKTVSYGSTLGTLGTTTRTGYSFVGWYADSSFSKSVTSTTTLNSTNFTISGNAITLYAKWNVITFDLKLSASDASAYSSSWSNISGWTTSSSEKVATQNYSYDSTVGTMPTPSRAGYTFKGWFTSSSGGTQYTASSTLKFTTTTTLYAQWTAVGYSLTVDVNGGTYGSDGTNGSSTSIAGTINASVTLSSITRTGYAFAGWKKTDGVGTLSGSTFTFSSGSATVTAQWTANTYKLYFDANGGTWSSTSGFTASGSLYYKTVTYDQAIGSFPTVTKTGYNFGAWYTSATGGSSWATSTVYKQTADTTLYAHYHYNVGSYTLTVDKSNGDAVITTSQNYGTTYTLPTPSKMGYIFNKWEVTDGVGSVSGLVYTFGAGNGVVTAKYTAITYTVKYNGNGNTGGSTTSSTFTYDVSGTLRANGFTRTGYEFTGWNTKADNTGTAYIDKGAVKNLTSTNGATFNLYAQWGVVKYTITFDAEGGTIQTTSGFTGATGRGTSNVIYTYNQAIGTLPTVTKTGYTFKAWTYSNGTTVKTTDKATADATFYATYTAKSYTLSLNALSGTLATTSGWTLSSDKQTLSKTITYDSELGTLAEPTLAGNTFLGWFTAQSGGNQYVASSKYDKEANLTLYAHYNTNSFTVFFDPAGGSVDVWSMTVEYNDTIGTLPTATLTGYDFQGWYYSNNTSKKATTSDKVTGNTMLFAKWSAKQFTVTFNANGGSISGVTGSTKTQTVYYDDTFGTFPTVTKAGSDLVGWFDDSSGNGKMYTADSIVRISSNITLYAVWATATEEFTVVFNANGGYSSTSSKVYEYNATYGTLPTPTRDGYKFLGWSKATNGTTYVKSTGKVTSAHTLYAQWQANTYYVTYNKNRSDASGSMTKSTLTYGVSAKLTANAFTCTTAVFNGWNTNASGTGTAYSNEQDVINLTTTDGATITLYAQWVVNNYQVLIDTLNCTVSNLNGFTQRGSYSVVRNYSHGTTISTLPTLTKKGHTLTGFKDSITNATVTTSTAVTADMQLIPQWTANTINITFKPNNGTFTDYGSATQSGSVAVMTVKYGDVLEKVPTVTRAGYTFESFYDESTPAFNVYSGTTILTESTTLVLVARWKANMYTLVFNAGSGVITGTSSNTQDVSVAYMSTIGTLPTATLKGNTFAGWYTGMNKMGTKIEASTIFDKTETMTVYAGWNAGTYSVSVSANGGKFSDSTTSKTLSGSYDESVTLPTPTRVGYNFSGYKKTSSDEGQAFLDNGAWKYTLGISAGAVEAQWTAKTIIVKFNYNGGTPDDANITQMSVSYDSTYGALPTATYAGRNFEGWFRADGTTVVTGADIVKDTTAEITLTAHWSENTYNLIINPNGGKYENTTNSTTKTGKYKATVAIGTPTRTGYTFVKWAEQDGFVSGLNTNGTQYTFGEGDGNIVAQWTPIKYAIHFDGNGNTSGTMNNQTITYDVSTSLTANAFVKTGYKFAGWLYNGKTYVDRDTIYNLVTTATTLTFTAQWDIKTYTLTIDPKGGEYNNLTTISRITGEYGSTVNVLKATRRGYDFKGYGSNSKLTTTSTGYTYTFGDADDTLTAQWEAKKITVTLNPNGATWQSSSMSKYGVSSNKGNGSITVTFGQTYGNIPTADDFVAEGKTFKFFYTDNGNGVAIISSNIVDYVENITLTAQWTTDTYTLLINPNGGNYKSSTNNTVETGEHGDVIDLATPIRTGYTFAGWTSQAGYVNGLNSAGTQYTFNLGNGNIVAQWTAIKYTIHFDGNGNTGGTMNNQTITYDVSTSLTANAFVKTGYNFAGWLYNGRTYVDRDTIYNLVTTATTLTFTAQWDIKTYTLTIDPKGGEYNDLTTISRITGEYGSTVNVLKATRRGYDFKGYGSNSKLTTTSTGYTYTFGDADDTLTAQWEAKKITVTLNPNGATWQSSSMSKYGVSSNKGNGSITVTFGQTYGNIPTADDFVAEGKTFKFFYTDNGDGVAIISSNIVDYVENITLTAQWTTDTYTLLINPNGGNYKSSTNNTVETGEHGDVIDLATPIRTGYTFAGWTSQAGYVNGLNSTGTQYTFNLGNGNIVAQWTAIKYTIHFDGNGNTGGTMSDLVVTYDESTPLTANAFVKTGYVFTGWWWSAGNKMYQDKDSVKNLTTTAETLTFTAQWDIEKYTLTIDPNSGIYNDSSSLTRIEQNYGTTASITVPTRRGYTFTGFTGSSRLSGNATSGYTYTFGAEDETITAQWVIKTINVTLDPNGATWKDSVKTKYGVGADGKGHIQVDFGKTYNLIPTSIDFVYPGFKFTYFYTNGGDGVIIIASSLMDFEEDIELTAKFETQQYTLYINPNGGTYNGKANATTVTGVYGNEVTIGTPVRTGYAFASWQEQTGYVQGLNGTGTQYTFGEGDGSLVAQWTPIKYTIHFDGNGNTGGTMSDLVVDYDDKVALTKNAFTKTGYEFVGWKWNTTSYDDQYLITNLTTTAETLTFTAQWEVKKYILTIDPNSGVYNDSSSLTRIEQDYDTTASITVPTRRGYTFTGFTGSSRLSGNTTSGYTYTFGAEDETITAQWVIKTINVTLNPNGATWKDSVKTKYGVGADGKGHIQVDFGKTYNLIPTEIDLVYPGQKFTYFYTNGGSGSIILGSSLMDFENDIELTAIFEEQQYTLYISPNSGTYNGSANTTTISGVYGNTVTIGTPVRTGYAFASWSSQVGYVNGLNSAGTQYTFGEGDGSLVAQWTPIKYTIRFAGNGNTGGTMSDLVVDYDDKVALTKNGFTKTGYEFVGWKWNDRTYEDQELIKNLTTTAETLTFTAQWIEKSYTLTIDPNGGLYEGSSSITLISGKNMGYVQTLAKPTRVGYTFVGFSSNANLSGNATSGYVYTFASYDDTITAQWQVIVITVTLDPNGAEWSDVNKDSFNVGADGLGRIQATFGKAYNLIPTADDLIYAGYEFTYFRTSDGAMILGTSIVDFEQDITLTASFTPKNYTLFVNPNGGLFENSSNTKEYVGIIGDEKALTNPTRVGYLFTGWEQVGRGTLATDNTKFTFADDDCRLTAQWQAITYTIAFNGNGSTSGTMAEQTFTYDSAQKLTKNGFARTGYTFVGWTLNEYGTGDIYNDEQQIINLTTTNSERIQFYAKWKVIAYTISFNPNGGSIETTLVTRDYGTQYGDFPVANKEGYSLDGWYTEADGGNKVVETDIVTGNITLYAKWVAVVYTVTLRANGGLIVTTEGYAGATGVEETTIQVTFDDLYNGLPNAEHATKIFGGWFTAIDEGVQIKGTDRVSIPRDHTLYAHWESNEFLVSFDSNGGSADFYTKRVNLGEPYGLLPTTTRVGYDFEGWYLEDGKIEEDTTVATRADHTLVAKWKARQFKLSFEFSGGSYAETDGFTGTVGSDGVSMIVTYGSPYGILPIAKKTGLEFVGWYLDDAEVIVDNMPVSILEDKTAVARYKDVSYKLTIELSGGTYGTATGAQTFYGVYNENIELLVPTRRGYNFVEYENISNFGLVNESSEGILNFTFTEGDTTLVAVWAPIDITITFHAQEGVISGTQMATSNDKKMGVRNYKFADRYDAVGVLPSCTLDGYNFIGWFTDDGLQMTDANTIDIAQNFDLYAKYSPVYYTLVVNPNGGVFNGTSETTNFDDKKVGETVSFAKPTREGYEFTRFVLSGAGSLNANTDGTFSFTFGAGNATLTANWQNLSYTLTFEYEGATGDNTTLNKSVTYDEIYGELPTPTKAGYEFVGWFTTNDESGVKIEASTTVKTASNHSLYAHWEKQKYTLQVILSGGAVDGETKTDITFTGYIGDVITFSQPTRYGYDFVKFEKIGDKGSFVIEGGQVAFTLGDDNCKLIAEWKAKFAEVTLDAGEGAVISGTDSRTKVINVEFGKAYGALGTLTAGEKYGYNFAGWYLGEDEIITSVLVQIEGNHTLTAKYEEVETSLTIILDGGTLSGLPENPIKNKFGQTFEFGEPTKEGYSFVSYSKVGGGTLTTNEGVWTFTYDSTDAIVTANWTAQTYVVTLDAGEGGVIDGTENRTTTFNVVFGDRYNGSIDTIPSATKYGYKFDGWYTESGERIIDTSTVSIASAHTLTARYTQPEYTLKIVLDGGTLDGQELTISGKHASEFVEIGEPLKTGYTFVEYQITSGDIEIQEESATTKWKFTFKESDATVIAIYEQQTYTLMFNPNGGNALSESLTDEWTISAGIGYKTVTYDEKIGAMPTPTREGYKFLGWSTEVVEEANLGNIPIYTPQTYVEFTEDTVLYAVWSADKFALTIELNGGNIDGNAQNIQVFQTQGTTYTIDKLPTKVGYTFVRFDLTCLVEGEGQLVDNLNDTYTFTFGAGNAVISCVYEPIEIEITLNAGSGEFDESTLGMWILSSDGKSATQTLKYGDKLGANTDGISALPQVALKGNKFTGWFLDDVLYSETSLIEWTNAQVTLTASFALNNYSLVINTDGGTYYDGGENDGKVGVFSIAQTFGSTYSVGSPVKEGYEFIGWEQKANTVGEGTYNETTKTFTFGADTFTLVAKYEQITYQVKFDANGGEGSMENQALTYDVPVALTKNAFTREGYVFKNWALGDGTTYADMGMIINVSSTKGAVVTLYAQWETAEIMLYFDANDGSARPIAMKVKYLDEFGTLPIADRTGYDFQGWYSGIVNGLPIGEALTPTTQNTYTREHTFVAYWTIASYQITMPTGYPENSLDIQIRSGYSTTVTYNQDFVFTIDVLEAYSQSNIKVFGNGKEILRTDGVYRIERVSENVTITITNLHINQYTISFNTFNGSAISPMVVNWGAKATRPASPVLVHYDFVAWYSDADLLHEFDFANTVIKEDRVLYAKYEKASYFVKFYVEDMEYASQRVEYLDKASKPTDPELEGHDFVGWYQAGDTNAYAFSSQVTSDIQLYAQFSRNTYVVKFYNGDALLQTMSVKYGDLVVVNFGTGIEGYTFIGWFADRNLTQLFDFNQTVGSDINIYAKYSLNQYTVNFYVGSDLKETQVVGWNKTAIMPTGLDVGVGFHIGSWYIDQGLTQEYDFASAVKEDKWLYGKIEKDKITITFIANNQLVRTTTVEYGGSFDATTVAIPARIGYDKVAPYWEQTELVNITSPITVYAVYTINVYTVKIVMPNGTEIYKEVEHGQTLTDLPEIKTKFGDKVVYDMDLDNITQNMVVHISVKNYIFWPMVIAGGILLLLAIIFIIVFIVKTGRKKSSRSKIKELIKTKGR